MIKQIEDIVRDVRIAIDENATSKALFAEGDTETLTLDEIIKSKIADSVRKVEMEAPARLLDSGENFGDSGVYWNANLSGWIILPDDFMRMLVFRMSDWERSVYDTVDEGSEAYALQSSHSRAYVAIRRSRYAPSRSGQKAGCWSSSAVTRRMRRYSRPSIFRSQG